MSKVTSSKAEQKMLAGPLAERVVKSTATRKAAVRSEGGVQAADGEVEGAGRGGG